MYPSLTIDIQKLKENVDTVLEMSRNNSIPNITMVVKAFAGDETIVKALEDTSITCIGDSRIQNLKKYNGLRFKHKMLLRIPMLSEIPDVVRFADISLNSELETIEALNLEAKKQHTTHSILLMFDLGDLREGIFYKEKYLETVKKILTLENINLMGIGTNLTCYGGVVPSRLILNRLVKIKKNIESNLGIVLEVVSGGNSSSVTLYNKSRIPTEINHLRLGESILFGKETSYSTKIPGLHYNIYELKAEIIEIKEKPSYPDGEISINSFGEKPHIEDKGFMKRAILAIGKQDVILENLFPRDKHINIIGGSSDHLILDVTKCNYKLGDIISFDINYPGLVHLMNSPYVEKIYK